jgi:CRP/FNR family transcriptional regulator
VLFRAGDVGDGCYRIQIGLVKIVVASQQGEERIISLLGPNAIVGELSMIDGRPRSASVVAIADCSLSYVSQDKFQKYSEAHPELTRTLARRLRDADEALAAADFAHDIKPARQIQVHPSEISETSPIYIVGPYRSFLFSKK